MAEKFDPQELIEAERAAEVEVEVASEEKRYTLRDLLRDIDQLPARALDYTISLEGCDCYGTCVGLETDGHELLLRRA